MQEDLFVRPPKEGRRELAVANLQAESYVEREHNARRTAPGVAHATSGIKANVLTSFRSKIYCLKARFRPGTEGLTCLVLAQRFPTARRMRRNTRTSLPQWHEMK